MTPRKPAEVVSLSERRAGASAAEVREGLRRLAATDSKVAA